MARTKEQMQAAIAAARAARKAKLQAANAGYTPQESEPLSYWDKRKRYAQELMQHFVQEKLSHGGLGFYLEDAYNAYLQWAEGRDTLGKKNFALHLEELGWERAPHGRRGLTFFENATLKAPQRQVNRVIRRYED